MVGATKTPLRKSTTAVRVRRLAAAIAILFIFDAVSIGARSAMGPQRGVSEPITEVEAREVGSAATFRSFGKTGRFFRVAGVKMGASISVPMKAADAALVQPASIRLFFLNSRTQSWQVVSQSKYDARKEIITAPAPGPGYYTAIGASRFSEVFQAQRDLCIQPSRARASIPEICRRINCPADGFAEAAQTVLQGTKLPMSPEELAERMGGICEECFDKPAGPSDFPECQLPGVMDRQSFPDPSIIIVWPIFSCFDAANGCTPGPFKVGQVDYDFEDEFDLIPAASTTPAYPGVDVRATVRYPAAASGVNQPVAGTGRYPLIIFLHGNHVTCPCSCSHTCPKANRIPNHLGYNYLLEVLASRGFIAASIDGFDVTCAGSAAMSDYEARGRLVLRHLTKWKGWDAAATDPWSGLFYNRVNMNMIGLSGHSRGGEGVVAAEVINRTEALGFQIKAVNAIAPTDQDPYIRYVPQVPYFLLLAASDGDVSNLQGLRTYDRTSPAATPPQSVKEMLWVHGANHNFSNTVWTPAFGFACASDDGSGGGRISDSLQRLVACQSIVPFFRLFLRNETGFRKLFLGDVTVEGLDGVRMFWTYQDPVRREVDNFDSGGTGTNSLGGPVTTSGGFSSFSKIAVATSPLNFHFTGGLLLGWSATQTYTTELPLPQRNVTGFGALALRVSQVIDALNPVNTPRTFRVSLKTTSGTISNVSFDVAGLQSVPYPYPDNGGKTVLGTIRIPLSSFRNGNVALPLNDIQSVILEFRGTGKIAVDDIQFTK